ncbi:MAG: CPXCG motif-containing cysteine-rich protein [Gammaproteobacteria bacterium]
MNSELLEKDVTCPHCWEAHSIVIDISAGSAQYIEDCSVCCHPMDIVITLSGEHLERVDVSSAL